jgi:indolepyruvate ferredoxin oxidoreductase
LPAFIRRKRVRSISAATVAAWQNAQLPAEGRTLRRALPLVARAPYFCSGCPHNTSTKTPDGALVGGGIGCHGLVLGMQPKQVGEVTGLTQMGGEGAQSAIAGGVNITYKLLYNSAVAMTGGQQAVGAMTIVETLLRSLSGDNVELATQIAALPDLVRGYEHVKLASVERYHAQIAELLVRYTTRVEGGVQGSE